MASKTSIANRALFKLGQSRVSNIETDSSVNAITMNQLWDTVRDSLLQSYPWNFATKRIDLAQDASDPAWGFDAQYTLPSDCLQLLEIEDSPDYQVEGGKILCNVADTLYIKYLYRNDSVGTYPPTFVEALAISLAIEACDKISDDNTKKQLLLSEYRMIMDRVLATDSIENPAQVIDEDEWITSRL